MSSSLIYVNPSNHSNPEDADLIARIGITLTKQKRAGWHEVYVAARNGVVTLTGKVSSVRNRQFIIDVTRHVAGVLRVKDDLSIAGGSSGQFQDESAGSFWSDRNDADSKSEKLRDQFRHLPVLSESLEDILAMHKQESPTNS